MTAKHTSNPDPDPNLTVTATVLVPMTDADATVLYQTITDRLVDPTWRAEMTFKRIKSDTEGPDIVTIQDTVIDTTMTRSKTATASGDAYSPTATWTGEIPSVICAALAKHSLRQQGIKDRMPTRAETLAASAAVGKTLAMCGEYYQYHYHRNRHILI